MLCPKCKKENTATVEVCIHCDEKLTLEQKPVASATSKKSVTRNKQIKKTRPTPIHHQRVSNVDRQPQETLAKNEEIVPLSVNIFIIVGTLILPLIGIIVGIIYLKRPYPEAKKTGRIWITLGFFAIAVYAILIFN